MSDKSKKGKQDKEATTSAPQTPQLSQTPLLQVEVTASQPSFNKARNAFGLLANWQKGKGPKKQTGPIATNPGPSTPAGDDADALVRPTNGKDCGRFPH